jgi:DNA-binding transcriptional ArsR family regulator
LTTPAQTPVKVVANDKQASLLLDPMRREILRLLSRRVYTAKDLSELTGLAPPSVSHHLKALVQGELISIARREAGNHGIVQKWYLSNAQAFVVDSDRLPMDIRRYFMPVDIERARGVAACLSVFKDNVIPSTSYLENLTQEICRSIFKTAQSFDGRLEDDPERVIHQLYVKSLEPLIG